MANNVPCFIFYQKLGSVLISKFHVSVKWQSIFDFNADTRERKMLDMKINHILRTAVKIIKHEMELLEKQKFNNWVNSFFQ